jgi:histidinol-phosphate aminotransferase
MEAKSQLLQLKPYQPGKPIEEVKRELGLTTVTKLASNENPFGSSPKVLEAIKDELSQLPIYPDGYATTIREKVAAYLNVEQEKLIFGNGSDEVIQILCRTFLTSETNTVMATPSFSQYKLNAVIEGAEIREIPIIEGEHDLQGMLGAIDERTRIVWVCSPNNPTGTYVNQTSLVSFLERVPKHVLVVCDEAYYEYVDAEDYPDTIQMMNEYPNLMILRTFSKAFGLASLRVGYGIAHQSIIRLVEPARPPFNVNRLGQRAAAAALEDLSFIETCKRKNRDGLAQYVQFCQKYSLEFYESQANFILIDFKRSGDEVFDYLLSKGFIVRSGNALGFPTSVRITVGSQQQNEDIIACLSHWLDS